MDGGVSGAQRRGYIYCCGLDGACSRKRAGILPQGGVTAASREGGDRVPELMTRLANMVYETVT